MVFYEHLEAARQLVNKLGLGLQTSLCGIQTLDILHPKRKATGDMIGHLSRTVGIFCDVIGESLASHPLLENGRKTVCQTMK